MRLVWKTGKTWEPGRERFCDAKERLEYVERRSFEFGLTVPSVRMGGRTDKLLFSVEDMMVDIMDPKIGLEEESRVWSQE